MRNITARNSRGVALVVLLTMALTAPAAAQTAEDKAHVWCEGTFVSVQSHEAGERPGSVVTIRRKHIESVIHMTTEDYGDAGFVAYRRPASLDAPVVEMISSESWFNLLKCLHETREE